MFCCKFQIFLNIPYLRIHPAFHVGRIIIAPVLKNTFIVHEPRIIQFPEKLRHPEDCPAAEGLISAGPQQNGRMVLIPLIAGINTVEHHAFPVLMVPRKNKRFLCNAPKISIPCTMCLHVAFRDHINPVPVTQIINRNIIRVMTGPNGIDIVLFHRHDILFQLFVRNVAAGNGTELMTVDALEHNPLPV